VLNQFVLAAVQFDDLDHYLIIGSFIILVILLLMGGVGYFNRRP
jgi:hypothetical protein